ncbi:hypothetical protein I4U23_018871 [Adineta vaga]|nr:hypothetical protein I4U23_018871 [Adineta vaga]
MHLFISFYLDFLFFPRRYVIDQGAIPPLCELLSVTDTKIIQVAFNGLENILKLGAAEAKRTNGPNPYAIMIEECFGLDKIEYLQSHENIEIYQKAFHLIETYFGVEEDENLPQQGESAPFEFGTTNTSTTNGQMNSTGVNINQQSTQGQFQF